MTILGQNTVDELRDLVSAKDYTIKQLGDARAATSWTGPDADAWDADWSALKTRYAAAHLLADTAFARAQMAIGVRDSIIPAPIEYAAVLKAIRSDPNTQTKGDLQDLSDRLQHVGVSVDYSQTPQPRAGTDFDLNVYKAADVAARGLDKAGAAAEKTAGHWAPWVVGGGILGLILLARR